MGPTAQEIFILPFCGMVYHPEYLVPMCTMVVSFMYLKIYILPKL